MKNIILIVLILTLAACGNPKEANIQKKETLKAVKTIELQKTVMDEVKNYNGELIPLNEVEHITNTGGDITKVNYENGDYVKKGDIILVLDDIDTKTSYLEASGDLIIAESNYETNKITYKKYETLFKKELISEDSFLTVKDSLLQSEGSLKIAQSTYMKTKKYYDELNVKSKISGIITDLDLKIYEKIAEEQSLFTVVDNSVMEIAVGLSASDLLNINKGSKATVFVSDTGIEFQGIVKKINPSSDSNTKKYEAKIIINNKDGVLIKGMYAKIKIKSGEVEGFFVPKKSIMIKDMFNYVVISRDGEAKVYKVELGISVGESQQIYLSDYKPEDKIVIQGQYLLENNDKLEEV